MTSGHPRHHKPGPVAATPVVTTTSGGQQANVQTFTVQQNEEEVNELSL
jgi:hypothetical protein